MANATLISPAILDRDHFDRQTFGDRDLQREIVELFLGQCARLGPAIAAEGAAQARIDAAHTLKGGARGVGAFAVAEAAEAAENGLRARGALDAALRERLDAAIAAFVSHVAER